MQSLNDIELDLTWFFQRGEASCGHSSVQGHYCDIAELGAWSHAQARDLFDSEYMVENVCRYRTVYNRLQRLPMVERVILQAACDSPESIRDVALTLAVLTPKTKELYGTAQIRKVCKKRPRKTREERVQNRREWLLSLCERSVHSKQSNEMLCEILTQARQLRDDAMRAYQELTNRDERKTA